jgi:hypothetical protein
LEPRIEKEAIGEKYQNFGISYKKNVDSYKNINVPTYTMEILKCIKKQVIVILKKMIDSTGKEMVTFMKLLPELGEKKDDKKIKVCYGHHIAYLKKEDSQHLL